MFEVREERLEELASEYEVSVDAVRKYATMFLNCSFITDEETYDRMLENAVSMIGSLKTVENEVSKERRSPESILKRTMEITFNDYNDEEMELEVDRMLNAVEQKRR